MKNSKNIARRVPDFHERSRICKTPYIFRGNVLGCSRSGHLYFTTSRNAEK